MDIHFNGYKIKYNLLNYYMQSIRQSHVIHTINIFIDLDDLYHTLRRPLINNEFQACGTNATRQLASNVLNIAGHYRNWAIKEGLQPTIYLVYTSNKRIFRNNSYIHNYRKSFIEKASIDNGNNFFINSAIDNSTALYQLISNYINKVYIIDSKYLEPSIIPKYIMDKYNSDWNIIISRDTYMCQYAYMDKCSMISPKGDNSTYINTGNVWKYVNYRERIYKEDLEELSLLTPKLFVSIKSIVGDRYRNIPRIHKIGWKTILNYLIKDLDSGISEELQLKRFLQFIEKKKVLDEEIEPNILCTNIEYQVASLIDTDKIMIDNQLVDKYDYSALLELNNKYFNRFPLNLHFLCSVIK